MALPKPSFESTKSESVDVAVTPIESGRVLREPRHWREAASASPKMQRTFHLVYKPGQLSLAKAQDITTEYATAKGSALPFSWTPWGEVSALSVRFVDDTLTLNPSSIVAYGCEFDLVSELF